MLQTSILTILIALISATANARELLIFGGGNHDEFLGCFNCDEYSTDSICNEFGKYGSEFSNNSIFNEFSAHGNTFSLSSPWNEFSTTDNVPVLVDRSGNFYGYFTINTIRSDAVSFAPNLAQAYELTGGDLLAVRAILCNSLN